ncbi:MAG TPA: hypothetical protein VEQ85_04270, partial [Lacipirellulaceae bacterium]|nr:hypothetical protein [Lacipirellulaceae bacterium]
IKGKARDIDRELEESDENDKNEMRGRSDQRRYVLRICRLTDEPVPSSEESAACANCPTRARN